MKNPNYPTYHYPNYKLFQQYGTGFHIFNGTYIDPHSHGDTWECVFMLHGKVTHYVNGKPELIGEGRLYLLRPDDWHFFAPYGDSVSQHICMYIKENQLKNLCDFFEPTLFAKLKELPKTLTLDLNESTKNEFLKEFHKIQTISNADPDTQATLIRMQFSRIISYIYTNNVLQFKSYPPIVHEIIRRMDSNDFINKNINEICKDLPYSRIYLSRLFKEATGETMSEYFKYIKLNVACNLLENSTYNSLEISIRIGYASASHFTREFKKYYGMSPARYRRLNMKKYQDMNFLSYAPFKNS